MTDRKFVGKEISLRKIDNLLGRARKIAIDEDSIHQKIFYGEIND